MPRPVKLYRVWRRPGNHSFASWEKVGELETDNRSEVLALMGDMDGRRLDESAFEYRVTETEEPPPADAALERMARRVDGRQGG